MRSEMEKANYQLTRKSNANFMKQSFPELECALNNFNNKSKATFLRKKCKLPSHLCRLKTNQFPQNEQRSPKEECQAHIVSRGFLPAL